MAADPPYMSAFVLPTTQTAPERHEHHDLYLPTGGPRPAIVFLPGMHPATWRSTARSWPTYVGYGSTAAASGVIGVVADIELHAPGDYPHAADQVAEVIDEIRMHPLVDADRVAIWAFSGAGLLTSRWLDGSYPWLRCVALSYPVLAPLAGWEVGSLPSPASMLTAGAPPVVLTRVGGERPAISTTIPPFLEAAERAGVEVETIDVAGGQHAFDSLDHTEESRDAVRAAFRLVLGHLDPTSPPTRSG